MRRGRLRSRSLLAVLLDVIIGIVLVCLASMIVTLTAAFIFLIGWGK
jgi:hypothetical protein